MRRSEVIPQGEKILYGIDASECKPLVAGGTMQFFKIFITDKAMYIVSSETGQILESWKYKERRIEASLVTINENCVQITEYINDGEKKMFRFHTYWSRKSISNLINYLVEQAQNSPE